MDKANRGEAKDFVEVLRDVVKQELSDLDTTAVCEVESVNEDKTLNLYVLPDKQRTIRNIINQCRYEFKSGDMALIYLINNRLSNSFVVAKYNPNKSDSVDGGLDAGKIKKIISEEIIKQLSRGGKIGSFIEKQKEDYLNSVNFYISLDPTSPASIYGGRWEQIKDCFLLAASDINAENKKYIPSSNDKDGGSEDAVVVEHNHIQTVSIRSEGNIWSYQNFIAPSIGYTEATNGNLAPSSGTPTLSSGESGTGKNMPPYKIVYVWKRIE